MLAKEDDWCIVRWHDGDLLIRRDYQWWPQAKNYSHKWEYVARNLKSNEEALKWVCLFKE